MVRSLRISKDFYDKLDDISPPDGGPKSIAIELDKYKDIFGDYVVNDANYVIERMYELNCGLPSRMALEKLSKSIGLIWVKSYCMVTIVLCDTQNVAVLTRDDEKYTIIGESLSEIVNGANDFMKSSAAYFLN